MHLLPHHSSVVAAQCHRRPEFPGCLNVLFSQTLQFYCNVRLLSQYVVCLSVCLSVVTRVYCDKTAGLKLGSCSFHYNVVQCLSSSPAKFDDEIRRGSLNWGLKLGWGGLCLRNAR